ncbi:OmpA/MotB domain protein [uncultured Paludibacter sp.]|uniref:OmpA/MotB domain protein n=1 Tax=uncultured Paludibacter sp. TaxID=497635 RepID=A0A653ACP0_9BACT|nr:OmpA/MotB domain protein [uncultured Paludibacter sp.]
MKQRYLFLSILFFTIQLGIAQDEDNRTAIGMYFTKSEYRGDLGNGLWNFDQSFNLGGSLSLQKYITPTFDLGIQAGYGKYNFRTMMGRKYDAFVFTNFKLNNGYIFNKTSTLSPFLTGGLGFAGYHAGIPNTKGLDFILPIGAGLKIQLTENIGLEYKYLVHFTNNDTRDGAVAAQGRNDIYGQHFAGLIISFGGIDTDHDGVKDKKDLCPNTPLGIMVDKNGCPLDTDGDGIPDYLDECPNVAGSRLFNGCPDSDGDGIPDNKDQCPNTPEDVKVNRMGCPKDYDNDGIPDYLDKCPDIKGLAKFEGCPDTDNDGIPDELDKCPTIAGLPQFNGCPDTDGDGIPDDIDKCPTIAGVAANKGCPNIKEETKEIFSQALQGIQFEIGKDVIRKESYGVLNKIVGILNENPAYNLEIIGHTDNQGNETFNQILSEKRAASVMKYLTDKGITASRLTSKGYGEMQPIADNKTTKGRYLNRRVEFNIFF